MAIVSVLVAASFFLMGFYIGVFTGDGDEGSPYPSDGKVLAEDSWQANSFIPPDTYANTLAFKVKEGATLLIIEYEIDLPSGLINVSEVGPFNLTMNPLVTLRLRGPDNEIVWNLTTNQTSIGDVPIDAIDGAWTLRFEAKGHSWDDWGVEIHDTARLTVTAF